MDDKTSQPTPRPAPTSGHPARPLDEADRQMVAELARDGRLSVRALAERLHISRANTYARLERLRTDGVITGFTARISAERAGLATSAYVSVSIEQNAWRDVSARLRELPFVDHIALVGAEFDALVQVRAPDNAALRDVVLEQIQGVPGVKATRTWLVFEEFDGRGADWS
ncbi:Lrp/AsnC family transcriptional regulator [Segeticoccus rhizosphaerae]|uniref:Lrp/AsnC family transcriptional regulator n=1 Tax=Segeticoccus rhizosphaerae TaxID=1104777 RepID=UPI0010C06D5B|nr:MULTISPECIES: Lrp/AsnC family transcriptional regulator [Intrasporangiaceae]